MPRKKKSESVDDIKNFAEQKRTLDNARSLLKRYHKCLIVRPTGFGKTWMLTELIHEYGKRRAKADRKVLYLYPSAVVANTVVDRFSDLALDDLEDGDTGIDPETIDTVDKIAQARENNEIPNCDLHTYAWLIRQDNKTLKSIAQEYRLIICDEAHRLGGPKTKIAMDKLFSYAPSNTDFIGATATPIRMDNFDVASHFYADRMTYIYTLYDAIEDKLIQKPNYCYATYNARKDLEEGFKADGQDIKDKDVKAAIDSKLIEIARIYNMPSIIKDVCDEHAKETKYMKFIVFFASKAHMDAKLKDVVSWFHDAYPKHEIKTLRISSKNKAEQANTDKLETLIRKDYRIDLIACIDMLNMGYHVSNQTGIMMYRGTKSNTIFTQQLGRALSAGAGNSAIVFDIVDNLHNKAVYDLYVKPASKKGSKNTPDVKKAMLDNYEINPRTGKIYMTGADSEKFETQYHLDKKTGLIVDKNGAESTFVYDPNTKTISNTANAASASRNINQITPACLNATGHEATYKEIIAKAMAEPLVQRCKYVLQLHFRSWCLARHIKYPITDEELGEMYGLSIQDFYDRFRKIIKANKLKYPIGDAEKLLKIGPATNDTDVPLSICCEARGVSIEQLTDLIFDSRKKTA